MRVVVRVVEREGQPVGLYAETVARVFSSESEGATTFSLYNPSDQTVGPFIVTLDDLAPERLFGWTAAAALSELLLLRSANLLSCQLVCVF